MIEALTKAEKLLIAAYRLDTAGRSEFSTEDLVVEAFRAFPRDFCMKGYPEYPDNNAILVALMGKDARLIVSGWLEKTGTKMFRITPKGMSDAEARLSRVAKDGEPAPPLRSDRKLDEALARMLDTPAFEAFRNGDEETITFHQFCRFIGLAAPDSWQKVQGKLQAASHVADEARKLGEAGQLVRLHFRGALHDYGADDLVSLRALLDLLLEKFATEMRAWERKARQTR